MLRRHCGQFGVDSTYGTLSSSDYTFEANFHKTNRNTLKRIQFDSSVGALNTTPVTASIRNNEYVTSPIPQSEFQYAWINNAVSSSNWEADQNILGYARKDGKFRTTENKLVPAINFPTASEITGV